VNTHISACIGSIVQLALYYYHYQKFSLTMVMNGTLAGLAGITPASGYIGPFGSFLVGFVSGVLSYFASIVIKSKGIDDVLDVKLWGILGHEFAGHSGDDRRTFAPFFQK
jgi:Amt family ammonium transporter